MSDPKKQSLADKLGPIQCGLRSDLTISRQLKNGEPHYVIHDPVAFQSHVFSLEDYRVVGLLNDRHTLQQTFHTLVERGVFRQSDENHFYGFVLALRSQNLLTNGDAQSKDLYGKHKRIAETQKKSGLMSLISLRIPLTNPDEFLTRTMPMTRFLFSRWFVLLWFTVGLFALYVLWQRSSDFVEPLNGVLALKNIPYLVFSMIGLKVWHELGHGYACKYYGGRVPEMGSILMMGMPLAYVDASAAWSFERSYQRLAVMLGGMYFESMLAIAAVFVWAFSDNGLLSACAYQTILTASVVTVLFNANPLMRYDGYFVAAELLGIQNLRQVANNELKAFSKSLFLGVKDDRDVDQGWYVRTVSLLYGICSGIYSNLLMLSIATLIAYRVPVVGVLLSAYFVATSVGTKVQSLYVYLYSSEEGKAAGLRAKLIGTFSFVVLPLTLVLAPNPAQITVTGLLSAENESHIRSSVAGVIDDYSARVGQSVQAGETLLQLANPNLQTELQTAQAEVDHARLVRKAMLDVDQVKYKQFTYLLARVSEQLRDKRDEFDALNVRSETAGTVALLHGRRDLGRYVDVGEEVATVISGAPVLRCYLTEAQLLQASCSAGRKVSFRFADGALRTHVGVISSVSTVAEGEFNDSALTQAGGGELLVDTATGRTLDPVFRVEITPEGELDHAMVGSRAIIRFSKTYEPLGWSLVRKMADFLTTIRVQ